MSAFIFFLKQNQILNKCARKNLAKNPRAQEFFLPDVQKITFLIILLFENTGIESYFSNKKYTY